MNFRALSRVSPGSLAGALLRAPLRLIPKRAVLRVRSGVNEGLRWVVGSSIHGCWLGHFEIEKQAAVRRLVRPGMRIFDIGANAGFYTLAFARLVGAGGHVWAFEPLPGNVRHLRRHIALNALENVTVMEAAVSDRSGSAHFLQAPSNAMGRLAAEGGITVRTMALDEFCARAGGPDLVKMDVEGAESAVLEGARRMLCRHRPILLLATHGRDQERRCVGILRELGYEISYLDGSAARGDALTSDELIALPAKGP